MHFKRSRIQSGKDLLDQTVLAGSIPGLENNHEPFFPFSIQFILKDRSFGDIIGRLGNQFFLPGFFLTCIRGSFLHLQRAVSVKTIILQ